MSSGESPDSGVEFSVQFRRVLDVLLPRQEQLWQLNGDGYVMDLFCYLGAYAAEYAAKCSRDQMQDQLVIPGECLSRSMTTTTSWTTLDLARLDTVTGMPATLVAGL